MMRLCVVGVFLSVLISQRSTVSADDDVLPPSSSINKLLPDPHNCGVHTKTRSELNDFPWVALIKYEKVNQEQFYGCGGVLISKRYVLTAAHCFKSKNFASTWNLTSVTLGEYNKNSTEDCIVTANGKECLSIQPIEVPIEEAIAHENFNSGDYNVPHDIGILRLAKDVEFSDYVKPICLPLSEEERNRNYAGIDLSVAGWGNKSENVKLTGIVTGKTNEECNSIYNKLKKSVNDKQVCAGGADVCKVDGGGPLMSHGKNVNGVDTWYAAGILSYGPSRCGSQGWPDVYTKVSKYLGWILKQMRE